MLTFSSRFSRLSFPVVICLLLCGILSTEIPELLCLMDNTANDFTVQQTISAQAGRVLRVTMPVATPIAVRVAEHEEMQFWTVTKDGSHPQNILGCSFSIPLFVNNLPFDLHMFSSMIQRGQKELPTPPRFVMSI
jgi:hypothetical protein